jgi:hypothetical protein
MNEKILSDTPKTDKLSAIKNQLEKINYYLTVNRTLVKVGKIIADSVVNMVDKKTPVSLVSGALEVISAFGGERLYYPRDFFKPEDGWIQLKIDGEKNVSGMFGSVVRKFPLQTLAICEGDKTRRPQLATLPIGKVGFIDDENDAFIFYKPDEIKKEDLFGVLVQEKIKELDSNFFSLNSKLVNYNRYFSVEAEKLFAIPSKKSKELTEYLQKCFDKDLHRSLLFYGPPGTGKSTLVQTILSHFGFRTFKFRGDKYMSPYSIVRFIIENFQCDAILIDDMDHMVNSGSDPELLETLELANRKAKLVIGCANLLSEFHGAVIRPQRFDELILVETLDSETIAAILGDLNEAYGEKVAHWPVSYINELKKKSLVVNTEELEKSFADLDNRVEKQLYAVGKRKKDDEEPEEVDESAGCVED